MAKPLDISGQRFGLLTAICPTEGHGDKKRGVVWECRCDCGRTVYATAYALRSGSKTHCGCQGGNAHVISDRQKEVILSFADCDMCAAKVAEKLYMCANTVNYHINQIIEKTGKNPRSYWDLVELVKMVKGGAE